MFKKNYALIILHEIYGVNRFIKKQCQKFELAGYDVFCPNLIGKSPYSYEESKYAYEFFTKNIGFEIYKEINDFLGQLKQKYEKVFIIGFSIGATIAWRCCENPLCSGVIAFYGSRIRDYINVKPVCPTLLLFAKKDSFNVEILIDNLKTTQYLDIEVFEAEHGFMDAYSNHYCFEESKKAEEMITQFLLKCSS